MKRFLAIIAAWALCFIGSASFATNYAVLGDINGDNVADMTDMNIIINVMLDANKADDYALRGVYGLPSLAPDLNADGEVDLGDLNIMVNALLDRVGSFGTEDDVHEVFSHCYGILTYGGPNGPYGNGYIDGFESAPSDFSRQLWNANELTTDEAICSWLDTGIEEYNFNTYDASHPLLAALYYRLYAAVRYHNYYLERYASRDAMQTAEVRLLRAMAYYHLLDLWRNVPLTLSSSALKPRQATPQELFNFIESELLDCLADLHAPTATTRVEQFSDGWSWGRADADAARLLLARLYLNAEVYTGVACYDAAARYAKQVMDGPHKLNNDSGSAGYSAYQMLFMGDNALSSAATEAILPLCYIAAQDETCSFGGITFLIASTYDWDMTENRAPEGLGCDCNGLNQQWAGNRTRPELLQKFSTTTYATGLAGYETAAAVGDDRALFNTAGNRSAATDNPTSFKSGYPAAKFSNFYSNGGYGGGNFPNTNYFLLRSAEAYLTFAEATLRNLGNYNTALNAVNALRSRAKATPLTTLSLNGLCDEWCREFYFEGRRRSDLVRFNKYSSGSYLWRWKGGALNGKAFDSYRDIFALPEEALAENSNLRQNPGYAQ